MERKRFPQFSVFLATVVLVGVAGTYPLPVGATTQDPAPTENTPPTDSDPSGPGTEVTCNISINDCDTSGGGPGVGAGIVNFVPGDDGTYEIPTGESIFANCIVELVLAGDSPSAFGPLVMANIGTDTWTENYWVIDCNPGSLANLYFYPDGGDTPPGFVLDDMIYDAYDRTPVLAFYPQSSPDGDEAISLLVHIPIYLWVDNTAWNPVSATASIPGGFFVTVTATPTTTTWSGGENRSGGDGPFDCVPADMVPYDPTLDEASQPSNCFMYYRKSSATEDHIIELAVTWDVEYTCSNGDPDCGGPLPDIVTGSTRDVIVKEIQAVATPNP